jgi:hypothetical protein
MPNDAKLDLKLPNLNLTARDLETIANDVINTIKERTDQGLDVDGKPFKPYSTNPIKVYDKTYKGGYAEYKAGKGIKKPNLKESGKLLSSIKARPNTDNGFIVSVEGVTYAEKVFDERPILGLTRQEIEDIKKKVLERIMENE